MVDQHLVQVAAGSRPQPTQDAQNFFMGFCRFFSVVGAPSFITVFFIYKGGGNMQRC